MRPAARNTAAVVELETERLRLRQWRPEDVTELERIYSDSEVYRFLGGPFDRERTEQQALRFDLHWQEHGFGIWVAEDKETRRMIGRVGLMRHDEWTEGPDKVEVGWTLSRAWWGRGLATEGALASIQYGFDELLLPRIISFTLPHNFASRRVMEKCGLTYRGTTPWRGLEHVWYAIDRDAQRPGAPA